jgi:hypothetical protein
MLGQDGFTTYDESLKEDVLVMVVPLCHLGDSPMHAEITNTTNPSVTLNPCRICTLGVETLTAKQDAKYTRAFVGLHQDEVCDTNHKHLISFISHFVILIISWFLKLIQSSFLVVI